MRNEKDNRKTKRKPIVQLRANFFETDQKAINKKWKISDDAPYRDNSKKAKKFKGNCYNYGKIKYHSSEFRKPKKNAQAIMIKKDTLSEGMQEMSLSTIVSQCNMIGKKLSMAR